MVHIPRDQRSGGEWTLQKRWGDRRETTQRESPQLRPNILCYRRGSTHGSLGHTQWWGKLGMLSHLGRVLKESWESHSLGNRDLLSQTYLRWPNLNPHARHPQHLNPCQALPSLAFAEAVGAHSLIGPHLNMASLTLHSEDSGQTTAPGPVGGQSVLRTNDW